MWLPCAINYKHVAHSIICVVVFVKQWSMRFISTSYDKVPSAGRILVQLLWITLEQSSSNSCSGNGGNQENCFNMTQVSHINQRQLVGYTLQQFDKFIIRPMWSEKKQVVVLGTLVLLLASQTMRSQVHYYHGLLRRRMSTPLPPACIHHSLKKQTRHWILFIHYLPSNIEIELTLINQWQCKHNQVLQLCVEIWGTFTDDVSFLTSTRLNLSLPPTAAPHLTVMTGQFFLSSSNSLYNRLHSILLFFYSILATQLKRRDNYSIMSKTLSRFTYLAKIWDNLQLNTVLMNQIES